MSTGPFAYPVGDIYVPCSWGCHMDRNPPSTEAGTDYASSYGATVVAPANGRVHDIKTDNSGAMGRVVFIQNDDNSWIRILHMSTVAVSKGAKLTKGKTVLGKAGASGYGSDWYYGPHAHVTCWTSRSSMPYPGSTATQDFEKYVNDDEPEEPDMKVTSTTISFAANQKFTSDGGYLKKEDGNTRLETGPSKHISATVALSIKIPEGVRVIVRPVLSTQQKDGSWKDGSLGSQDVYYEKGDESVEVRVPIDVSLSGDDKIIRVLIYAHGGTATVVSANYRGAEFN